MRRRGTVSGKKLPPIHIFSNWLEARKSAWGAVDAALVNMPPLDMYNEETWEWTVGKDYWDNRALDAAYMLDMVTNPDTCGPDVCNPDDRTRELDCLIESANSLEAVFESDPVGKPSPAMVKNAGIAYSKMVQGKFDAQITSKFLGAGYPFLNSTRDALFREGHNGDWSEHASYRTLHHWRRFVNMPGAASDPSYASVKKIVEYLEATDRKVKAKRVGGRGDESAASETGERSASQKTKPKKKKSKKKKKKKKQ